MREEWLITVDDRDRPLAPRAKSRCHEGKGVLHRAFSVYLFDDRNRLLLQQRSENKPLWPGHWANSCCSHPRWGEKTLEAAARRVHEELGIRSKLERVFAFRYHADFAGRGAERELCHVLIGRARAVPRPDPFEVADWNFLAPEQLDVDLAASPERFTPWLQIAWTSLRRDHWRRIERL